MQMRGHVTPTAESWKSSHPSSYTGSRLPATSIHTDEAQTLPISRQFRERVYPLEYVALIKYNELSLSLSLCLVAEPEGATLLTLKPAYGSEHEPIHYHIEFNATHSITSMVIATI
jgi:hypothetical protein